MIGIICLSEHNFSCPFIIRISILEMIIYLHDRVILSLITIVIFFLIL